MSISKSKVVRATSRWGPFSLQTYPQIHPLCMLYETIRTVKMDSAEPEPALPMKCGRGHLNSSKNKPTAGTVSRPWKDRHLLKNRMACVMLLGKMNQVGNSWLTRLPSQFMSFMAAAAPPEHPLMNTHVGWTKLAHKAAVWCLAVVYSWLLQGTHLHHLPWQLVPFSHLCRTMSCTQTFRCSGVYLHFLDLYPPPWSICRMCWGWCWNMWCSRKATMVAWDQCSSPTTIPSYSWLGTALLCTHDSIPGVFWFFGLNSLTNSSLDSNNIYGSDLAIPVYNPTKEGDECKEGLDEEFGPKVDDREDKEDKPLSSSIREEAAHL